jgi:hypothetical protein
MGSFKAYQAAMRRVEREEKKRSRELARLSKEQAKLSALEQARLEVEAYENQIALLLSVHQEACDEWDWLALASALPEPPPDTYRQGELRAKQNALVAFPVDRQAAVLAVDEWQRHDKRQLHESRQAHAADQAETENLRDLARRILLHESMAYIEAFAELNPVAEISSAGSLRRFSVENEQLIECVLKASAIDVIPAHVKSLTAGGKVAMRTMAKSQYHELYQDYICGCALRVAREVFAMLPVQWLLTTVLADVRDPATEAIGEHPVLSVAMDRATILGIDYGNLDTTEAIEHFQHRGNFKASRKTGAFQPITPLVAGNVMVSLNKTTDVSELSSHITRLLETIRGETSPLIAAAEVIPDSSEGNNDCLA